jgi:calpain family cysteine protease
MLGNSGNPALQGTSVGLRGLTRVAPGSAKRSRRGAPVIDDRIDRVNRETEANPILGELAAADRDQGDGDMTAHLSGHSASWRHVDGDAFRSDARGRTVPPVFSDVEQGNLGDSWLLAACAAVAHVLPRRLIASIHKNEDGAFSVRLGKVELLVTADFPTDPYADPAPNGQKDTLWPALVEKAFAIAEGGSYAHLEGGNPGRALESLTGEPAVRLSIARHRALDRLFAALKACRESPAPIVIHTLGADTRPPLEPDHHYAVLEIFEREGARLLKIYNPWGSKRGARPLEDAILEIEVDRFRDDVEAVFMTEVTRGG